MRTMPNGKLKVDLFVVHDGANVRLSCRIKNIGEEDVKLHNSYLFLDQGVFNAQTKCFEFPFLQKKYLGLEGIADEDCIGCAQCRKGEPRYPSDCEHIKQFYNEKKGDLFCCCYELPHLSSSSILYMAQDEQFSEEIILSLSPGVYRAILMCVPEAETCDCMCCNRCFTVM